MAQIPYFSYQLELIRLRRRFKSIGATKISNNRQTVFTLDHDVQNRSPANLSKYSRIEAFANSHDIDFYPAGRGIGHQIMIEEGYAFPGVMTVASDSHSNMYGGVGCVGTPIVRSVCALLRSMERLLTYGVRQD